MRRQNDVSKLTFPLQLVVLLVTVSVTVYGTQAGLRSDIRDISTRIDVAASAAKDVRAAEQQTFALRDAELRRIIDEHERRLKYAEALIGQLQQELIKVNR